MTTVPDIMFSATPGPAEPWTSDGAAVVHAGTVIADRTLDIDGDRRVDADRDGMTAARIDDFEFHVVGTGGFCAARC
jgi:hypothetical protein